MSLTPANARKTMKWKRAPAPLKVRVALLILVIVLAFFGLVARLWYLQIYHGEELSQESEESRTRRIPTRGPRGDIKDRNGHPLADSRQSLSLEIEPDYKKTNPLLLQRLAPILHLTPQELEAIMEEEKRSPYAVRLADNLSDGQVAQIEEQRLYMTGAIIQPNPIRHYPLGTISTHLLGYLGMIDAEELQKLKPAGYRAGDYVGKGGIERQYNDLLRGTDGGREVEVDPAGRVKRIRKEYDALPGNTLLLSIDERVQWAAQQALAAGGKPGAAVAIDPRNGEILALASYPTYDIRPFSTRRPKKLWDVLAKDKERKPLLNRAISAQYPPASTFKPLLAAYALEKGVIPENMTVFCAGGMKVGRQWKGCHKHHGWIGFNGSISESCDVFYYTIAQHLGKGGMDKISEAALMFGLGAKTGVDLAENADGDVPTKAWRKKHKMEHYYLGDTMNTSIGQGALHATPIQMANAVAAIANGGTLYRPHMLLKAKSWDAIVNRQAKPQVIRKVPIDPDILSRIRYAMRQTVTTGTGKVVALPTVEVAAKTGTAQTRIGRMNHGWFTCFAPYQSPKISIAVIIEEGEHGGEAGGPVAKAMLEAYFGLKKMSFQTAVAAANQKTPGGAAAGIHVAPLRRATPAPIPAMVARPQSRFTLLRGTEAPLPTRKADAGHFDNRAGIKTPLGVIASRTLPQPEGDDKSPIPKGIAPLADGDITTQADGIVSPAVLPVGSPTSSTDLQQVRQVSEKRRFRRGKAARRRDRNSQG